MNLTRFFTAIDPPRPCKQVVPRTTVADTIPAPPPSSSDTDRFAMVTDAEQVLSGGTDVIAIHDDALDEE